MSPSEPVVSAASLDQRIGWLHSTCLGIDASGLKQDTPVTIVKLDDSQSIVEGRIVRAADTGERCPALLDDRRGSNTATGLSFYEVGLPPGASVELGVGVIGSVPRVDSSLDVNGDGRDDKFTQCATSEGASFAVWSGTPYEGTPLWSGYYYLGYDTESNCPDAAR